MFLKKVTLKKYNKTYNYYKIVASYRDKDGKPKHRMIQNLGVLSDEDAARMKKIIQAQQSPDMILAKSEDIVVTKHWLFLPIMVLHALWETFQLHRFFPKSLLVEAMVLNRCIEPLSKIHVMDWMKNTALPALHLETDSSNNYAVYRGLDRLHQQESDLQSHLYKQLERLDPSIGQGFFYDITSTYMEGSQCVIAKLGYSRDHRPDREQIVIALMVTPQGSPFYWKVLEGNTQDITTLPNLAKELKQRFGLNTCHLVFDRGMVSVDHLELLEDEKMTYLSAMDKDEMAGHPLFQEFVPHPASKEDFEEVLARNQFESTDENEFFFTREGQIGERRFVFSFDVSRFFDDIASREKRMVQALAWITEQNAKLSAAKKSRKAEIMEREVKQMLSKRKLKSLLQVTITPIEKEVMKKDGKTTRIVHTYQLTYDIDKKKETEVRRRDGVTCFMTNDSSIPQAEIISKYREKNKVEEAFREMKSQLSLRPIHLTRPERVKAHVTLCVLAYLLMNTMEMILSNAGIRESASQVLKKLESCQLNGVGLKGSPHHSITLTELTEQQKEWVKLLDVEKYIKPPAVKKLIESIKR